jgi:hypothetical protein
VQRQDRLRNVDKRKLPTELWKGRETTNKQTVEIGDIEIFGEVLQHKNKTQTDSHCEFRYDVIGYLWGSDVILQISFHLSTLINSQHEGKAGNDK